MKKLNTKFKIPESLYNSIEKIFDNTLDPDIETITKQYPDISLKSYAEYRKFVDNLYHLIVDIDIFDSTKEKRKLVFFLEKHYGSRQWRMLGSKIYNPLYNILEKSGVWE
jgi:hypothetical protein